MKFKHILRMAVLGLVMTTSAQAAAAVVMFDNDTIAILGPGLESQFTGNVLSNGGAGSWEVNFEAQSDGYADAFASIGNFTASTFTDLKMMWINNDAIVQPAVISITDVEPVVTTLDTYFINPVLVNQKLRLEWSDSVVGAGFDVEMGIVPVPAAVWLFGSGLLGLVGVARRKAA